MTDTVATLTYDDKPVTPEQWQEWLDAGAETLRMTFVMDVASLLDEIADIDVMNDYVDDLIGAMYLTDLSYGVDRAATAALWATYPTYTDDSLYAAGLVMWVEATIQWDDIIEDFDLAAP